MTYAAANLFPKVVGALNGIVDRAILTAKYTVFNSKMFI